MLTEVLEDIVVKEQNTVRIVATALALIFCWFSGAQTNHVSGSRQR